MDVISQEVTNAVIRKIGSERELVPLMHLLAAEIKQLLKADLVSVFLYDSDKCELYSLMTSDNQKICFDARLGIAGAAAMRGEVFNIRDAYEHPLFYREVDAQTGYRTRTILAMPIKNIRNEVIGVCEAINKLDGVFTDHDVQLLDTFAQHAGNAIETALMLDELKSMHGMHDSSDKLQRRIEIGQSHLHNIIGMSPQSQTIIRLIDQLRGSAVDVLIQGESGTGKELIARALHYNSPRYDRPFVALNCAALPEELVEAELYGIEKGVATGVDKRIGKFEAANGGTLFLDEIGDLSLTAQAKILRVLQERVVDRVGGQKPVVLDVRVIAATNKKLEQAIGEKQFRDDLYYRLKVVDIETPALREIPEDIPLIANHFLSKHCALLNFEPKQFTAAAMERLRSYSWPGNARQLENEIKRLVVSVRGESIDAAHLSNAINRPSRVAEDAEALPALMHREPVPVATAGRTLADAIEALERKLIEEALRKSRGNKQHAAQELGLSRQGLIKKLKRLGIGVVGQPES